MIDPFLKWAGGKRWLVFYYPDCLPPKYNTFREPFCGSAAVFFHLNPAHAILSDNNAELIKTFKVIREKPNIVEKELIDLEKHHSLELYRYVRSIKPKSDFESAMRFLYLNRTCFNGIYRVNLKGEFNVPMGSKAKIAFPRGYLESVSNLLKNAEMLNCDFEENIAAAKRGDFVFLDPPYTVMHNNNNFIKYNAKLFCWDDQMRLAKAIQKASKRGVLILLCNANHQSVRDLYREFGNHKCVTRWSKLSSDPQHRQIASELIIKNY